MPKKYIKEKGIVRAVTTDNLQLEKPLANENYDIEVHNRNMDKIDNAIQEVKGKVDGLELVASNVKMADGTNVETTVTTNKNNISTLQSEVSANKTSIQSANAKIDNNTNLANQALNKANEAFQRGDNVKTQLVDKLISEGLDVSTNNTFEELIGGIALGKKWASGHIRDTFYCDGYKVTYKEHTFNLNLEFAPSLFFVSIESYYDSDRGSYGGVTVSNLLDIPSLGLSISDVSSSSFTIGLTRSPDTSTMYIGGLMWYAFE